MRPPEVRAAWQRGDIQATFIWDPVLAEVKKDGKVILTSGQISADTGKATFDGLHREQGLGEGEPRLHGEVRQIMATSDDNYRKNAAKWTRIRTRIKAVAQVVGRQARGRAGGHGAVQVPVCRRSSRRSGWAEEPTAPRQGARCDRAVPAVAEADREDAPDYSVAVNPSYAAEAAK
jgi:ABC-type taurine transport system substrate-binding protein